MKISTQYININHSMQNLLTLSTNMSNPVLLIIHGGAGSPDRPLVEKYNAALAEYYNVVCWDQRGSGLSYTKDKLTIDMLLADLKSVVEYLKAFYSQEKIYIAGHSWGAYLGVRFASMYPEYVKYYIGTGQGVSSLVDEVDKYNFVSRQAESGKDKKVISKLAYYGRPDGYRYQNCDGEAKKFISKMIHKYGGYIYDKRNLSSSAIMLSYMKCYKHNIIKLVKGMIKSSQSLNAQMNGEDKISLITELSVPVLLISGENDAVCPVAAAQRWFDKLKAPEKAFIKVENAAHMVNFEQPEIWNKELIQLLKK